MIYLILFSSFCLNANAKIVNRQAYKVCKTNKEAYWNGSSAQCCDTTTHELVKNYTNGIGENGYACCQFEEDGITEERYNDVTQELTYRYTQSGWMSAGAINGSCCGGYTIGEEKDYSPGGEEEFYHSRSYTINQNGGVYYCAKNVTTKYINNPDLETFNGYIYTTQYTNDGEYCIETKHYRKGELDSSPPKECCTSTKGDPSKGVCEYIFS